MNRTSERIYLVKLLVIVCLLAGLGLAARAQGTNLTALLQAGLFAEQGDHDLDTAIADYQMLASQYDKDRQLAATAVFRLGECYRAQNRTNNAVAQYRRVLKDFADQKVLATMSEQNLNGLGAGNHGSPQFQERLQAIVKRAGTDEANASSVQNPEIGQELAMVKKVQAMKFDDIIQQAPTLVPDATLNNLINQYNQSVLDLLRLGTDYGPDSDQMKKAGVIRDGLAVKITDRLAGLRQALMTELDAAASVGGAAAPTQEMDSMRKDLANLESQYDQLSKLPKDQARLVVQQDYPNPVFTGLMQQLLEAQQKYAVLANDFSKTNIVMVRVQTTLDIINQQIDEQMAAVKESLKDKIQVDELELSRLQDLAAATGTEPAKPTMASEEDKEIQRIQDLVQNSPDLINAADLGETPLGRAAANGWLKVAAFLLDHGAQVNPPGTLPLFAAANAGNRAMVEFLLSRGADVNAAYTGKTALQVAVKKRFRSVVEVLLTNRADVNLANSSEKESPLFLAADGPPSIVQMLLAAGARVDVENFRGDRPLGEAIAVGFPETIQLLLAAKADVNTVCGDGILPLCLAADRRDTNIVQMLLAAGATVDGEDKNGRTALSYAAAHGAQDSVKILLAAKADPNAGSMDEPLLGAIHSKDWGSAELLLAAGAEVDKAGPFDIRESDYQDYVDHMGSMTPLFLAIYTRQVPMVQLLLKHGAHPDDTTMDGRSLVFRATVYPEILSVLLDAGANANAWDETRKYQFSPHTTVLQQLVNNNHAGVVRILLEHGADPNLRDAEDQTALHWAFNQPKDTKIVQLLLDHGADPNVRNNYGQTPLMLANAFSDKAVGEEIARVLREHGALDRLPDWDRITVSRPAANFSEAIFYKGTNDWNHFTLFETLLNSYDTSGSRSPTGPGGFTFAQRLAAITSMNNSSSGLPFPDLSHITIVRPSHDSTNETRIPVDLLNDAGAIDAAKDMTLEFGDVVEIPESDHALGDSFTGLPQTERDALANPLKGQVQLVVKGKTVEIPIYPEPQWSFLGDVLGQNDAKAVLLTSSDLSRVKVTRHDAKTGRDQAWTVNGNSASPRGAGSPLSPEAQALMIEANYVNRSSSGGQPAWVNDLWLRNGDVIEVPEKQ